MSSVKHPQQPFVWEKDVVRFKANKIVRFLLDNGPFDMNQLACMNFTDEDHCQFAQLIGYSAGGYCELSYVSDNEKDLIDDAAHTFVNSVESVNSPEPTPTAIERVYKRIEHEQQFLTNSYPTVVHSLGILRKDIDEAIKEAVSKAVNECIEMMHPPR